MTMWSRRRFGGALAGAAASLLFAPRPGRAQGEARVHRVEIRRFAFVPAALTISPGDRVEWTNHDIAPHTATAKVGSWNTGRLDRGETRSVTFAEAGRSSYVCTFHPHMTAEITVAVSDGARG